MKIDMHVHYSGQSDDISRYISEAKRKGLDGICITNHNTTMPGSLFENTFSSFVVLRGVEYSSEHGHLLIYGVDDEEYVSSVGRPVQAVIDYVSNAGGMVIPSHPFDERLSFSMQSRISECNGLIAIETNNASRLAYQNKTAENIAKRLGLKGVGGSDAHCASDVGNVYTVFEKDVKDMNDLLHELKYGNYHPEYSEFFMR